MTPKIELKLQQFQHRHEEISGLLSQPEIMSDQNRFRELSKEYANLEPIVTCFSHYQQTCEEIASTEEMLSDIDTSDDVEMKALAKEELLQLQSQQNDLNTELQRLLLPQDPNDECNIFLEIRAGTGGDEAAIFVGDLFRMYSKYAERQRWQLDVVSASEGDHGGYKEIISQISGDKVYAQLKFESGAHRVQRVPETESQGRVHTSACTVAIMPEVKAVEAIELKNEDLRIDTYRASGAGGQHVNTTDSAVRITHIPTGVVAECQDERSQHKNKAKAMSLLNAKILAAEQNKQQQSQADTRRSLVGSGDRSERIRTYNYPQGRVTDHRINLTLYKLPEMIEGNITELLKALAREHQIDQLTQLQL